MYKRECVSSAEFVISDQRKRFELHFQLLDTLYEKACEALKEKNGGFGDSNASVSWLNTVAKWQDIINSIIREEQSYFEWELFSRLEEILLKLMGSEWSLLLIPREVINCFSSLFKLITSHESFFLSNTDKVHTLIKRLIHFTSSLNRKIHRNDVDSGLILAFSVINKLPKVIYPHVLAAELGLILSTDSVQAGHFIFASFYAAYALQQAKLADHQGYINNSNKLILLQEYYYLQKLLCEDYFFYRQGSIAIGGLQIDLMRKLFSELASLGEKLFQNKEFKRAIKCFQTIDAFIESKLSNINSDPVWNELFRDYARKSNSSRGLIEHASLAQDSSFELPSLESIRSDNLAKIVSLPHLQWEECRENLMVQPIVNVTQLLQDWSQATRTLIANFCSQTESLLGAPPCSCFSIFVLGSLARDEATFYSDYEWTLIWDGILPGATKNDIQQYFKAFTDLIQLKIQALCETHALSVNVSYIGATEIGQAMRKGFRFDEGGHYPFTHKCTFQGDLVWRLENIKSHLVFKAKSLSESKAELQRQGDDTALYVLLDANYIYGNNDLAHRFLTAIRDILGTRNKVHLKVHQILGYNLVQSHNTVYENKAIVNLKDQLLRPIQRIIAAWAMYYDLQCLNTELRIQSLVDKQHIHSDLGTLLKVVLQLTFSWRIQSQIYFEAEQDTLLLQESSAEYSLLHFKEIDALNYVASTFIPELLQQFSIWRDTVNEYPDNNIIPMEMTDWNCSCYMARVREQTSELFGRLVREPSRLAISLLIEIFQKYPEKGTEPINMLFYKKLIDFLQNYHAVDWPLSPSKKDNLYQVSLNLIQPMLKTRLNLTESIISLFNTTDSQKKLECVVQALQIIDQDGQLVKGIVDYFIKYDVVCDVANRHHLLWAQGEPSEKKNNVPRKIEGRIHREWAYCWYQACVNTKALSHSRKTLLTDMVMQPDRFGYRLIERLLQERLLSSIQELSEPALDKYSNETLPFRVKLITSTSELEIHPSVVAAIINKNTGHLRHTVQNKQSSQAYAHRAVAHIFHRGRALHFKEHPDFPLMAYANYLLNFRLCGHGSTPNEFVIFEVTWDNQEKPLCYPVLVSLTVFGKNLEEILSPEIYSQYNFSRQYLSEVYMMDVVKHLGDGFPRNYIVTSCDNGTASIACIDLEQAFVNPFSNEGILGRPQLREISISYCLPQFQVGGNMCEGLDPSALETFSNMNVSLMLNDWLDTIKSKEIEYQTLLNYPGLQTIIEQRAGRHPFIGNMLLAEGVLGRLTIDLHIINNMSQRILANRKARQSGVAFLWALKFSYPLLYNKENIKLLIWQWYIRLMDCNDIHLAPKLLLSVCSGRKVSQCYFPSEATDPSQLLKFVANRNITASSSEYEKFYLGTRKSFSLLQKECYGIEEARAEIKSYRYEKVILPEPVVRLVKLTPQHALVLDFTGIPENLQREKIERLILSDLQFSQLYFKECTILDDLLLSQLLRNSRDTLSVLSILNHVKITEASLNELGSYFSQLKVLIASGIGVRNISNRFNAYFEFNSLEALFLNHCPLLQNASIKSTSIKYIEIADNPQLTELSCVLPRGTNGRIANNLKLKQLSLECVNVFGIMNIDLPILCRAEIICKIWKAYPMSLEEYKQRMISLGEHLFNVGQRKLALICFRNALAIAELFIRNLPISIWLLILFCLHVDKDYKIWRECLNSIYDEFVRENVFFSSDVYEALCGALISPFNDIKELAAELIHQYLIAKVSRMGLNITEPLIVAVLTGQLPLIDYWVKQGADLTILGKNRASLLHYAARYCQSNVIEHLVRHGANLEAQDEHGETPLSVAALEGNVEAVKLLITLGASLESVRIDGKTPVMVSAACGNLEVTECLVELGADWRKRDNNQFTVLHFSVEGGHEALVKFWMERVTIQELDVRSYDGITPQMLANSNKHLSVVNILRQRRYTRDLIWANARTRLIAASKIGNLDTIVRLVEETNDWKIVDWVGRTVLHYAAEAGQLAVVEFFVKQGINWKAQDAKGCTVLHYAAGIGHLPLIKYLLDLGCDLMAKNNEQQTALHIATAKNFCEAVSLLTSFDVNLELDTPDIEGRTPLVMACVEEHIDVVKILYTQGHDIDREVNGVTLLMISAVNGKLTTVKYLVSLGVNLEKRGASQHTALHFAACRGERDVVEYLLSSGAELAAQDVDGNTPLHVSTHHLSIVQLLCQNGADIAQRNNYGFTVAQCAAIDDNLSALSFLSSQQTGVCHEPLDQLSSINQAILFRNEKKLRLFLESPDVDDDIYTRLDDNGNSLLHCAVGFGCPGMQGFVIEISTIEELHALNAYGYAPLHLAVFRKDAAEIIRWLAKRIIDIDLKDKSGKTALEYAIKFGNARAVRTLLRYGAAIPLHYIETQYPKNVANLDRMGECLALLRPLVWNLFLLDTVSMTAKNITNSILFKIVESIYCRIFDNCESSTLRNLRQTNRNTRNVVDKYLSNRWKLFKPKKEHITLKKSPNERVKHLKGAVNLWVAFGLFAQTEEERQRISKEMADTIVPDNCVIQ